MSILEAAAKFVRGVGIFTFLIFVSGLVHAESDDVSLRDHQVQIYQVSGSVKVLTSGAPEWMDAKKGMRLSAGDQVLTTEGSFLEISYDDHYLNLARIEANTRAQFISIEPTYVKLEDGSIFSALDGLHGSSYQVSTPVAVAAVRGTHFEVEYQKEPQKLDIAVLPDSKDYESRVEIETPEGKLLEVSEGAMMGFQEGVWSEPQPLKEEQVAAAHEKVKNMTDNMDAPNRELREKSMIPPDNEVKEPEKDEKKAADVPDQKKESDDQKKPGQLPPGGNDGGGSKDNPGVMQGKDSPKLLQPKEDQAKPMDPDVMMDSLTGAAADRGENQPDLSFGSPERRNDPMKDTRQEQGRGIDLSKGQAPLNQGPHRGDRDRQPYREPGTLPSPMQPPVMDDLTKVMPPPVNPQDTAVMIPPPVMPPPPPPPVEPPPPPQPPPTDESK